MRHAIDHKGDGYVDWVKDRNKIYACACVLYRIIFRIIQIANQQISYLQFQWSKLMTGKKSGSTMQIKQNSKPLNGIFTKHKSINIYHKIESQSLNANSQRLLFSKSKTGSDVILKRILILMKSIEFIQPQFWVKSKLWLII